MDRLKSELAAVRPCEKSRDCRQEETEQGTLLNPVDELEERGYLGLEWRPGLISEMGFGNAEVNALSLKM